MVKFVIAENSHMLGITMILFFDILSLITSMISPQHLGTKVLVSTGITEKEEHGFLKPQTLRAGSKDIINTGVAQGI